MGSHSIRGTGPVVARTPAVPLSEWALDDDHHLLRCKGTAWPKGRSRFPAEHFPTALATISASEGGIAQVPWKQEARRGG